MLNVLEIIKRTSDFLAGKGVENPRLNAELIIGQALGLKRMQLYLQFERPLTEPELEVIRPMVRRRGQHEPLQYIFGSTEFFGATLKVDRRALIPRPETEQLAALVVEKLPVPPARILDLGTGTGALALGLAKHFAAARVTAVDLSPEALALAGENCAAAGLADRVSLRSSDWFAALDPAERFELIVANPPYLSAAETEAAAPEVRNHEPRAALTPGPTGLEALEQIVAGAGRFLAPGGLLAMETGITQHEALRALLAAAGLGRIEFHADLSGRPRFALAWRC